MRDNAQSRHPAQAEHTPRAYCTATSPAVPAVPGCCRTRPQWRYNQWKGWCHLQIGLPPGWCVHVIATGKHFLRVIMVEILISFHLNSSFNDFEI